MAPSLPFYVFSSIVDKMRKYDISISVYNENEIAFWRSNPFSARWPVLLGVTKVWGLMAANDDVMMCPLW